MTIETQTRPLVVHAVTAGRDRADALEGYDVRSVGLLSAGFRLGAAFGDFDSVREAAARADIRCCPVCHGLAHRAGARAGGPEVSAA